MIKLCQETLSGTCGVHLFYNFRTWGGMRPDLAQLGGADLGCAGFIDTPECKTVYKKLAKKFKIVYQSTPRFNRNSHNQFFFVVYERK